jgi:hypothetical protein
MFYRAGCFSVLFFSLIFSSLAYACEPQVQLSAWKRMSGDKPGFDLGYLHCHNNYFRSFIAFSVFSEDDDNYYGATYDLRLQPSWKFSPYLAVGGTGGVLPDGVNALHWKGSLFSHYSLGIAAEFGALGINYSVAELDERGDLPDATPIRHLVGLTYRY